MIFINGEAFMFESEKNLSLLFKDLKIDTPKGIAVAVNNTVISRNSWEEYLINDTDKITIITATQGG
ncbi:MAG: sulfur carrier protein ThiS [Bacteroidota bacterium]|nr:sulfur carrier protein ThiS [Bacteroidota bacterium]